MKQECPQWVRDEPFIQALLLRLLRKHEQGKAQRLRITGAKFFQPMFDFEHNAGPERFRSLELLAAPPFEILEIRLSQTPKKPFEMEYEGALIVLRDGSEALVREWLGLSPIDVYQLEFQDAVYSMRGAFADKGLALLKALPSIPGRSATEIVQAFAGIPDELGYVLTVRELSATCFWGDSKFLDTRLADLEYLFPGLLEGLARRPILLQVFVPVRMQGILIVENQDTFMRACLGQLLGASDLAVVFGAGFKSAAGGIRSEGGALFCYIGDDLGERQRFERVWVSGGATIPTYFFGDLDWSGMGILAALRQLFPNIQAWAPGYETLRKCLVSGFGHMPEQARKELQVRVRETGCRYADNELIPLMAEVGRFVDQECQLFGDHDE